jgi:tRNA-binding protein
MEYITYEEFSKLDIRIGKVINVENIKGYKKIAKAKIDLGNEQRDLIVGGAEYYNPEDLVGKIIVVLANLQPKTIAGIESQGMILAADVNGKPYWLTVDKEVPLGSKVR